MAALGHDFFDGYVWGRAAAMGADVSPPVVVAAFGAFDPTLLTSVLLHGRSISSREAVLEARADGAAAGLHAASSGIAPAILAAFGERMLVALAGLDATGRPLFGALRELDIPDDAYGRAWRASELIREHRGDGHTAARVAAGIDVVAINVLTERWLGFPIGEYSATRGFSPDRIDAAAAGLRRRGWIDELGDLTVAGRHAREQIEAATDRSQDELVTALGSELDELVRTASVISAAVLSARAAPADARKRAAG